MCHPSFSVFPVYLAPLSTNRPSSNRLPIRPSNPNSQLSQAARERERALATPILTQRARVEGGVGTYTIAPKSNVNAGMMGRAPGRSGEEQFRKMKAKNAAIRK